MKKIIISTLRLDGKTTKRHYPVDGNNFIEYPGKVYYAINAVMAQTLTKDDDVKVILLETAGGDNCGQDNAKLFMDELHEVNTCGANIENEVITVPFEESKSRLLDIYRKLIKVFEQKAEVYVDITYGPKPLPMVVLCALQFAEKFYECNIANIVYGKVEFKNGNIVDGSEMIYDLTPLYTLSSFCNVLGDTSSENALKAVDTLFRN